MHAEAGRTGVARGARPAGELRIADASSVFRLTSANTHRNEGRLRRETVEGFPLFVERRGPSRRRAPPLAGFLFTGGRGRPGLARGERAPESALSLLLPVRHDFRVAVGADLAAMRAARQGLEL